MQCRMRCENYIQRVNQLGKTYFSLCPYLVCSCPYLDCLYPYLLVIFTELYLMHCRMRCENYIQRVDQLGKTSLFVSIFSLFLFYMDCLHLYLGYLHILIDLVDGESFVQLTLINDFFLQYILRLKNLKGFNF